ncbi:MAG: endonuclease [Chloroflexota bacterium]|nr:endonuclease [Chloroflexota bacterium]
MQTAAKSKPKSKRRAKPDPVKTWVKRLDKTRPNLMTDTLDALRTMYGRPTWGRIYDPTSELILTMLSANSADIGAEKAFNQLCRHWPAPGSTPRGDGAAPIFRTGWGGVGISEGVADWAAIEFADIAELTDVIRIGGLANQKAPRIQAALRHIREQRGDYSLEFLGGLTPPDALAWLTQVNGIGRKTASVLLLFSFGMPLMPVDRHIERVAIRIGLIPKKIAKAEQMHDMLQMQLTADNVHEAHVNLITHGRQICHSQRPEHERCAIADRCRYFNPTAP